MKGNAIRRKGLHGIRISHGTVAKTNLLVGEAAGRCISHHFALTRRVTTTTIEAMYVATVSIIHTNFCSTRCRRSAVWKEDPRISVACTLSVKIRQVTKSTCAGFLNIRLYTGSPNATVRNGTLWLAHTGGASEGTLQRPQRARSPERCERNHFHRLPCADVDPVCLSCAQRTLCLSSCEGPSLQAGRTVHSAYGEGHPMAYLEGRVSPAKNSSAHRGGKRQIWNPLLPARDGRTWARLRFSMVQNSGARHKRAREEAVMGSGRAKRKQGRNQGGLKGDWCVDRPPFPVPETDITTAVRRVSPPVP